MLTRRIGFIAVRLALALYTLVSVGTVSAQTANKSVPVRFVLSERFSGSGVAAVIQQTGGADSEFLIAIRREFLSPEMMSACLKSLTQVIAHSNGRRDVRSVAKILETAPLASADGDQEAKALLNRLRSAGRRKVGKIKGDVQSFQANVRVQ